MKINQSWSRKSVSQLFGVLQKVTYKRAVFFFASGILVSVPLTFFVEQFDDIFLKNLPSFFATLIPVVVVAPFLEEFAKAFPLFYRQETPKSIFILAILVGLGFGIYEFFNYVIVMGAQFLTRLSGIFFHPISTSITSYGIATNRTLPFYLLAVCLHFLNNFFSFFHQAVDPSTPIGILNIGSAVILAAAYLTSWRLYNKTRKITSNRCLHQKDTR